MNCDSIAPIYRAIEYSVFGRALERSRFVYLSKLKNTDRILVLGEGDGRCLQRLLQSAPNAEIDVIDSSKAMLALAKQRIGSPVGVRFHHTDAVQCQAWPRNDYDAVVTHFFLDCFGELEARIVVKRIADGMKINGIWLVSDFAIPETGWRRWHAAAWIRVMYWFFGIATGLRANSLPPYQRLLEEAGMVRQERTESRHGMLRSEVWIKSIP